MGIAVWLIVSFQQSINQGEIQRIAILYAAQLVTVNKKPVKKGSVSVDRIEDLVKLAERNQSMIMHASEKRKHFYYFKLLDTTYIFETEAVDDVA